MLNNIDHLDIRYHGVSGICGFVDLVEVHLKVVVLVIVVLVLACNISILAIF